MSLAIAFTNKVITLPWDLSPRKSGFILYKNSVLYSEICILFWKYYHDRMGSHSGDVFAEGPEEVVENFKKLLEAYAAQWFLGNPYRNQCTSLSMNPDAWRVSQKIIKHRQELLVKFLERCLGGVVSGECRELPSEGNGGSDFLLYWARHEDIMPLSAENVLIGDYDGVHSFGLDGQFVFPFDSETLEVPLFLLNQPGDKEWTLDRLEEWLEGFVEQNESFRCSNEDLEKGRGISSIKDVWDTCDKSELDEEDVDHWRSLSMEIWKELGSRGLLQKTEEEEGLPDLLSLPQQYLQKMKIPSEPLEFRRELAGILNASRSLTRKTNRLSTGILVHTQEVLKGTKRYFKEFSSQGGYSDFCPKAGNHFVTGFRKEYSSTPVK